MPPGSSRNQPLWQEGPGVEVLALVVGHGIFFKQILKASVIERVESFCGAADACPSYAMVIGMIYSEADETSDLLEKSRRPGRTGRPRS